jgi:hypothetical protein
MGPCMCGDLRCMFCGPAKGNNHCEICGKWDDEGGCDNPAACNNAATELNRREVEMLRQEEEVIRALNTLHRNTSTEYPNEGRKR